MTLPSGAKKASQTANEGFSSFKEEKAPASIKTDQCLLLSSDSGVKKRTVKASKPASSIKLSAPLVVESMSAVRANGPEPADPAPRRMDCQTEHPSAHHSEDVQGEPVRLGCFFCDMYFPSFKELCAHKTTAHKEEPLKCCLCDFSTRHMKKWRNHLLTEHGNKLEAMLEFMESVAEELDD